MDHIVILAVLHFEYPLCLSCQSPLVSRCRVGGMLQHVAVSAVSSPNEGVCSEDQGGPDDRNESIAVLGKGLVVRNVHRD